MSGITLKIGSPSASPRNIDRSARRRGGASAWVAQLGVALAVMLSAMSLGGGAARAQAEAQEQYALVPGDQVKITVFGEPELSGEFEIDPTGALPFPLIGTIGAGGRTARGLEAEIDAHLRDGYIINPRVNVEVVSYRPYFVMGEVNNPGKYEYRAGLSVISAIAIAGDFTPRADKRDILVTRGGEDGTRFEAEPNTVVQPGDIVEVRERLF